MPFSMDMVNADDFGFYEIRSGARWIGAASDINANVADWMTYFRPPYDIPEVDVQVQESVENFEETTFTDASGNTQTGTVEQKVDIFYEVDGDLNKDNKMLLAFVIDAPTDVAFTSTATIVQYVQYRKADNYGGDWRTIACKTSTDDPSASEVINYKGTDKVADWASNSSFSNLLEMDRENYQ